MSRIVTGCKGLNHANWLTDYYPEDLPPEWRLSFYANDFSVLLLPQSEWQDIDWLNEQLDEFDGQLKMYCQIDDSWPEEVLLQDTQTTLGDHFAGWIARSVDELPEYICTDDLVNSSPVGSRYCADLGESSQHSIEVFFVQNACSMAESRQLIESSAANFLPDTAFIMTMENPPVDYIQQFRTLLEIMAIA